MLISFLWVWLNYQPLLMPALVDFCVIGEHALLHILLLNTIKQTSCRPPDSRTGGLPHYEAMSTLLLAHGLNPTSPQHCRTRLDVPSRRPAAAGPLAEKSAQLWESAESAEIPLEGSTSWVLNGAAVTWQSENIEMYLLGDISTPGAMEGC